MQRTWITLIGVDRVLSARVLASHLDPNTDAEQNEEHRLYGPLRQ